MSDQASAVAQEPRPIGRPSKYNPIFCEMVIEWGKLGKSKAWMCAEMDISPETMSVWCKEKPDFSEAMARAVAQAQRWWEDAGQGGMLDKSIDASIWSRSMAARFPADWREKSESTQTLQGPDGAPLAGFQVTIVDPARQA